MALSIPNPEQVLQHLMQLQRRVRQAVIGSHDLADRAIARYQTSADTIYGIDTVVEPVIEQYLDEWSKQTPLVLIAEGIEPETGKVFPASSRMDDAEIRLIIDPIDGTRGLMYDKRPAWCLAGVAPNQGSATRLSDIEIACMTELPTSKMGHADVLWAIRGQGAHGVRDTLEFSGDLAPAGTRLLIRPSQADTIRHGFSSVTNYFPGIKKLAAELLEYLVENLLGEADVTQATVFDDQYISTGGQFYELLVGHDRFCADLRPTFYKIQNQPPGLCCHPYDCCTMLIAQEAGIILTDEHGLPLDGPIDTTTGINWIGYANPALRQTIEPLVMRFLKERRA